MRRFLLLALLVACLVLPASAWWPQGHSVIAEGALKTLPVEVPVFFRADTGLLAHCAQDADVIKNRDTPAIRETEEPEHFIDWELLGGRSLPAQRYQYVKLCAEAKLAPEKVGTLPYAVAEWTERLAVAFAEHRKWPENPHIRTKCLVYAGSLAHYAGDLSMPLHCTVHFNGRARPDGTSPRTGIHAKVDSLIEKVGLKPEELARDQQPAAFPALMPAILKEIERSRALVDRTYELEPKLPPETGDWTPSPEVKAYTLERGRAGTRFLGSLYLTAWRNSSRVRLPPWLMR